MTISADLVSHLQYQFYIFSMAVVDMVAVTEFVTVQAHNGKEEEGTSRRVFVCVLYFSLRALMSFLSSKTQKSTVLCPLNAYQIL